MVEAGHAMRRTPSATATSRLDPRRAPATTSARTSLRTASIRAVSPSVAGTRSPIPRVDDLGVGDVSAEPLEAPPPSSRSDAKLDAPRGPSNARHDASRIATRRSRSARVSRRRSASTTAPGAPKSVVALPGTFAITTSRPVGAAQGDVRAPRRSGRGTRPGPRAPCRGPAPRAQPGQPSALAKQRRAPLHGPRPRQAPLRRSGRRRRSRASRTLRSPSRGSGSR